MAEKLSSYEWPERNKKSFDVDKWLDGGIYRLKRPIDFKGTIYMFRLTLTQRARMLGVRVRTRTEDADTVVVQAVSDDD